jgi:ring-1,2-phenylacetyl-CoA epoxidase subunit PaaC
MATATTEFMQGLSEDYKTALKDLLYKMADDALVYAHRNSEWTGFGPTLEEDIAFSSIAQDKLGHSLALFQLLEQVGEPEPDTNAFTRNEKEYHSCHFVEIESMDYAFALVRHFMFDTAERIRYSMLEQSTCVPLAQLAVKIRGEVKYHLFHANIWVKQLGGNGSDESRIRIQNAINECYPLALGIFEPSKYESALSELGIFAGEKELQQRWQNEIQTVLTQAGLSLPENVEPQYGGRYGYHTEYLQPLIDEMTEVFRIDPSAQW